MQIIQAIILGIVQGITEFIPVSSDGHLIIARNILNFKDQGLAFDIILHLATLIAVIIYFKKDLLDILRNINKKSSLFWQIIIGTIPAIIIGFLIKNLIENYFRSISWTAVFLIVNGLFFIIAEKIAKQQKEIKEISWKDSLWIGLAQAAALLPGISRSGSTISTGLIRKFKRTDAAKFSFLLSTLAIIGASSFAALDLFENKTQINGNFYEIIFGFLAALISGYFAIKFLLNFFKKHTLLPFAIYIICLGTAIIIYKTIF